MHISLAFGVLSGSLRRTAASLSEEKLSISHVEMVHARRTAAWSVFIFGLASPSMNHQPFAEGCENEDFFGFRRSTYFESREVGRDTSGWLRR